MFGDNIFLDVGRYLFVFVEFYGEFCFVLCLVMQVGGVFESFGEWYFIYDYVNVVVVNVG